MSLTLFVCKTNFRTRGRSSDHAYSRHFTEPGNQNTQEAHQELARQKNEHIVAIAMFVYDVHNVTKSHMSFRQETLVGEGFLRHGPYLYQDTQNWNSYREPASQRYKSGEVEGIFEVFGFDPHQMCGDHHDFALPIQRGSAKWLSHKDG